ncbi:MAG: hypothetical protein H3Z51_00495 [archaeon]|nr:hypothetical protein [archaeon]
MKKISRSLVGVLFILLSLSIVTVSAFVYQQANQTVGQNIVEVATITLKSSDLGSIDEGDTKTYTKSDVPNLGNAISITTTKATVYLHLDSDLNALNTYYNTYNIVVKFATVPPGSSKSGTACTLSLSSPDYHSIDLDVSGTWTFDFEITTNPKSVNSNTATTVTIVVSAEST